MAPPYGRRGDGRERRRSDVPSADGVPTYYDRPALHPPPYRWLIAGYFFAGGLAGAAQVLATAADLAGGARSLVRAGRFIALGGAIAGPALLVGDLRTPRRWYNMLRIFRRTSPMSIGSWTIAGFGALSAAAAVADLLGRRSDGGWPRYLERATGVPAAALGAVMCVYTGVLTSATSVPLWAAAPRALPALFGASATSTAVAAITLAEGLRRGRTPARALSRMGLLASALELAMAAGLRRAAIRHGVGRDLLEGRLARIHEIGAVGLGVIAPLVVHGGTLVSGRRSRALSLAASAAALAGGLVLRATLVFGGRRSAARPREYFRFTGSGPGRDGAPRPEPRAHG